MLEHPEYYDYREKLITFLEDQDHKKLQEEAAQREALKEQQEASNEEAELATPS